MRITLHKMALLSVLALSAEARHAELPSPVIAGGTLHRVENTTYMAASIVRLTLKNGAGKTTLRSGVLIGRDCLVTQKTPLADAVDLEVAHSALPQVQASGKFRAASHPKACFAVAKVTPELTTGFHGLNWTKIAKAGELGRRGTIWGYGPFAPRYDQTGKLVAQLNDGRLRSAQVLLSPDNPVLRGDARVTPEDHGGGVFSDTGELIGILDGSHREPFEPYPPPTDAVSGTFCDLRAHVPWLREQAGLLGCRDH